MSCCAAAGMNPTQLQETATKLEHLEQEQIKLLSIALADGRYKTEFVVPDMHCAACIAKIEHALAKLNFVEEVRANLSFKTVSVIWQANKGTIVEATKTLKGMGFENHVADEVSSPDHAKEAKSLLLALAIAGFAAANIMLLSVSVWSGADAETAKLFHLISGLIAIPTVAFSGRPFFYSALKAITGKRLNMDVPISLAVILAVGMSVYESLTGGKEAYFDASVTLLFFLLIGRYLDLLMRNKARGAVARLSSISAKDGVLVTEDDGLRHLALKDIRPGMILRVFAGERFPVNGQVIKGQSDLDRSHVTGESATVFVETGHLVEAGTLNLTAPIDIEAVTDAQGSFLAEMRRMMEAAEKGRSNYIRIADRMAQIYAPAVHLLALIAFIGWMIWTGGDWHISLYTAIAVLIVTCPCALGLAVPVAHVLGANRLMSEGIMMRDGTGLERLAEVDTVIFDKTGTLTTGQAKVMSATNLNSSFMPVLRGLAASSHHPSARAVYQYLTETEQVELTNISEVPGYGMEALYKGKKVRLGRKNWVMEITDEYSQLDDQFTVAFALENGPAIGFVIIDSVRKDAAETIQSIGVIGLDQQILSGDNVVKVSSLARQLQIETFFSNYTPGEKLCHIERLRDDGRRVLMVGDGINDAPALAGGHASMAPASAADVGRHSADFVFTRTMLGAVPFSIQTARFTSKIVRQNFSLAIAYNCIAVPLAMAGFVTPLVAAIAMSASSIAVVSNSMRINFVRRDHNHRSRISPQDISLKEPYT
ncbi:MAG: heavy metal translocating P-type ATPase [Pseudomonadota bacterium]